MDARPIGVFDSGLGGLTAVKALRQILPEEKLIYFGDTARVPYGGRSKETLLKYARQDVRFLRSFDLKAIVIACGTVSTTSLDTLQAENDLPIVGVVEPTCRRALLMTKNKKVGIIATLASIRSGAYEAALRRLHVWERLRFLLTEQNAGAPKTQPRIFQLAAQKLHLGRRQIAVVEDSLHALEGAKNGGFFTIGIADPENAPVWKEICATATVHIHDILEMKQFF